MEIGRTIDLRKVTDEPQKSAEHVSTVSPHQVKHRAHCFTKSAFFVRQNVVYV
ncbi:hypothetical protein [Burkholderia multivorans]|uniref:hypothetical protein n=1 Tax=Burkholderia multivorans TaxID=87883 RepID=UPI001C23A9CA|nr:hypothetical protein [Burkholderia multivorans]